MGNPTSTPHTDDSIVAKRIHHIWIGSLIKKKERDYAAAWAEVNNGADVSQPSEPYTSNIWVDPDALMVNATKQEITRWAEWKALQENQITDVSVFDQKMRNVEFRHRFTKRVLYWASQQRYSLNEELSGVASKIHDFDRIERIATLRAERLNGDSKEILKILRNQLSDAIQRINTGISDGTYKDINAVLNIPEYAPLKAAYLQELNLRQNMAAAADIARVLILRKEGGVYADLDLLPRFKSSAFIMIAQGLEAAGYVMPEKFSTSLLGGSVEDWTSIPDRLLAAVTDAVVLRLGLIDKYQATKSYEIFAGELPGAVDITASDQARQREILTRVVDSVLTEHYTGKFDCFHRFGNIDPIPGFGFSFYKKQKGSSFLLRPNNQFIVSADPRFISDVYKKLKRNYEFLMDPSVADMMKEWSHSGLEQPNSLALQVAWWQKYGVRLKNNLAQAMASYMADGIEPYAVSTVVISGPVIYEEVAQAILAEMREEGDTQSERQREIQDYNPHTSDNAESSWWVSTHGVAALRARQFPDAPALPTLSHGDEATWNAPTLAAGDAASEPDTTTRYKQQFIIQLDGDEVSLHAAQVLFGKHPGKSNFIQLRDDEPAFFFSDPAAEAAYRQYGPGQFLDSDGDTRLSFVGHGYNANGETTLGGKTVPEFIRSLALLLRKGAISSDGRLVINLVACATDDLTRAASETFAGQLVEALPGLISRLDLTRDVEVHARLGALSIDEEGRKSQSRVVYRNEGGQYVRQTTLDLSAGTSDWEQTNLASLGLSSEPSGQAGADQERFSHQIILTWDEEHDNLQAAVANFNRDPVHSTYVDLARGGRTVFLDEEVGLLMVREGYSALPQPHNTRGNVNITIFGQSVGTAERPIFDGLSPKQLVDRMNPVLARVFEALNLSQREGNHLTITLEGIDHADPLLEAGHSFLGHLADEVTFWLSLQPQADQEITLKNISFETRAGHLHFDSSGDPVYVSATGKVLHGEMATLYDAVHRGRFEYDPISQRFQRALTPSATLRDVGERIAELRNHLLDTHARNPDLDRLTIEYLKLLRHGAGAPTMTPRNRSIREEMLADLNTVLDLRRQRLEALAKIELPGEGYVLVPERVEALGQGKGYRLGFTRRTARPGIPVGDGSIVWVHTDNDVFMRWLDTAREYGHAINSNIVPVENVGRDNIHFWLKNDTDVHAAHTVSTAYLLQALIGPETALLEGSDDQAIAAIAGKSVDSLTAQEKERIRQQLPMLRSQLAVNYAQLTNGTLHEAVDLVRAVNDLKGGSEEINSALGSAQRTLTTLGVAFDVANVVLASIDFANARTVSERTRAGARLSVALVTSGMSMGALAAAGIASDLEQAGLTELAVPLGFSAEVLGALSTPVAGVGMGVVDVIDAYDRLATVVDSTLHTLERAAQEVRGPALQSKDGIITFTDGLVLRQFDLASGQAVYGSVRIRGLKKYNRFVAPDASQDYLDVYRPFLSERGKAIDKASLNDGATVVLPNALQRDYDYSLVASPGWRYSHEFASLEKLEQAYPDRFYWWTYRQAAGIFGWDYSPSQLRTTYHATPFTLKLDASARGIVVPLVENDMAREMLFYTLVGDGGKYTVALPTQTTALTIQASTATTERWYFDLTHAVFESVVHGREVVQGNLRQHVLRQIRLTDQQLSIAGKEWANFGNGMRPQASLFINLDPDSSAKFVFRGDGHPQTVKQDRVDSTAYLQFDSLEAVDPNRFHAIADTLVRGGLDRSIFHIMNRDESLGVVDLKSGRWAIAHHDSKSGVARFYLDGAQKISLRSVENFNVGAKSLDGETVFMATMVLSETANMMVIYVNGSLKQAIAEVSGRDLFDAATGAIRYDLTEHQWIQQLPANTEFTVVGRGNQSMTASLDIHDHGTIRPHTYAFKTERFSVEVDVAQRRAVVAITEGGALTAQDFIACRGMFATVSAIDFNFSDHSGLRSRFVIDTAQALFQNKAITLSSTNPLDLVVKGRTVKWILDGEDIVLRTSDAPDIKWLNATSGDFVDHTLDVNKKGAKTLLDALRTSASPTMALEQAWVGQEHARAQQFAAQQMAQAINAYPGDDIFVARSRISGSPVATQARLALSHTA